MDIWDPDEEERPRLGDPPIEFEPIVFTGELLTRWGETYGVFQLDDETERDYRARIVERLTMKPERA